MIANPAPPAAQQSSEQTPSTGALGTDRGAAPQYRNDFVSPRDRAASIPEGTSEPADTKSQLFTNR